MHGQDASCLPVSLREAGQKCRSMLGCGSIDKEGRRGGILLLVLGALSPRPPAYLSIIGVQYTPNPSSCAHVGYLYPCGRLVSCRWVRWVTCILRSILVQPCWVVGYVYPCGRLVSACAGQWGGSAEEAMLIILILFIWDQLQTSITFLKRK